MFFILPPLHTKRLLAAAGSGECHTCHLAAASFPCPLPSHPPQNGRAGYGLAAYPQTATLLYDPDQPPGSRFTVAAVARIARLYHSTACFGITGLIVVAGSDDGNGYYGAVRGEGSAGRGQALGQGQGWGLAGVGRAGGLVAGQGRGGWEQRLQEEHGSDAWQ